MQTTSRKRDRRLRIAIGLTLLLGSLSACQADWEKRPYMAARPAYGSPAVINPMRIGGYAGYNYGRGRRVAPEPVQPIVEEPPLAR